jgi:hypothetical protein
MDVMMNEIVHFLSVQETKRVFNTQGYGIARSHEALANPDDFYLEPLLVVGITHQDIPIQRIQYCEKSNPIKLTQILSDFWMQSFRNRYASPITGKPDHLVIDRRLEHSLTDDFFSWLNQHDIQHSFSTGTNRKFTAKFRKLQDYPILFVTDNDDLIPAVPLPFPDAETYPLTLKVLNEEMDFGIIDFLIDNLSPTQRELIITLYPIDKPRSPFELDVLNAVEYNPYSDELSVKTSNDIHVENLAWEYAIKDTTHRGSETYLNKSSFGQLLANPTKKDALLSLIDDRDTSEFPFADDYKLALNELRIALKCSYHIHPNMLTRIGFRLRSREEWIEIMRSLIKSDYEDITDGDILVLRLATGLREYTDTTVADTPYNKAMASRARYGCLFNITSINQKEMVTLWNGLTCGGDADYILELVPESNKVADPSFRLFVVWIYTSAQAIFLADRGGLAEQAIDSGDCNSNEGVRQIKLKHSDYAALLKEACNGQYMGFLKLLHKKPVWEKLFDFRHDF